MTDLKKDLSTYDMIFYCYSVQNGVFEGKLQGLIAIWKLLNCGSNPDKFRFVFTMLNKSASD